MKTNFSFISIFAILFICFNVFAISCKKDEVSDFVTYKGKVVYKGTSTPFADLEVKLTDGTNVSAASKTDEKGSFSIQVDLAKINGNYYFLVGDATCIPQKVEIPGFGEKECDLGVIEVEGPNLPVVRTKPMTDVAAESAIGGGFVDEDGRLEVIARGICYSQSEYPTIEDAHTQDGAGKGEFNSTLKNLEHNVAYYVRAYATNKKGTSYGEQVKFITEEGVPVVTTDTVINITAHTAKCKAQVESDGGYPVVKRGICYSKKPDPTIDDDITEDGSGLGEYTGSLKNLVENTTYYIRSYATNSTATTYGEQIIITTLDGLAVVRTDKMEDITATSVVAHGTVVFDCDIPVTARGFCYAKTQYPTIDDDHTTTGKGLGSFQATISKLEYDTKYYIRAYATNATETAYGEQLTITTLSGLPTVTISSPTKVLTKSFVVNANITSDGGYPITTRGVCWSSTNANPSLFDSLIEAGTRSGSFSQTISNLQANTTYYVCAYATNSIGTVYSTIITQKTGNGLQGVHFATNNVTDIRAASATCKVIVDYNYSDAPILSEGCCWSSSTSAPTINDAKTDNGQATTSFTSTFTNLQPSTTYYVRAYITTSYGTAYSANYLTFTTTDGLPIVSTNEITTANVTSSSFTCGGNVIDAGDATITSRGICWNTTGTPTITDTHSTNGTGTGSFTHTVTGISPLTRTYYICAYATNKYGTAYGETIVQSVNNPYHLPVVTINGINYMIYPQDLGEMNWTQANNACNNLTTYGFSDWRLPTEAEADLFRENQTASSLFTYGTWYWTSSQDSAPYGREGLWYYSMIINPGGGTPAWENSLRNVRPIRISIQ